MLQSLWVGGLILLALVTAPSVAVGCAAAIATAGDTQAVATAGSCEDSTTADRQATPLTVDTIEPTPVDSPSRRDRVQSPARQVPSSEPASNVTASSPPAGQESLAQAATPPEAQSSTDQQPTTGAVTGTGDLPAAVTVAMDEQSGEVLAHVDRLTNLVYVALFLLGANTILLGLIVALQLRTHQTVTFQRF